jgi:hypothetical protein
VTVIATGFDRAEGKKADDARCLAISKETQDIPTIIRNRWEQERFVKVRPAAVPETRPGESAEDRYDIPAFLRRKAE